MLSKNALQTSFQTDLANVVFGSAPDPTREQFEVRALTLLQASLKEATSLQIFRAASSIDARVIPVLSGRNLLSAAKLIEMRAPAAIDNMPNLRRWREHLRKTAELEKILSPAALDLMIKALRLDDENTKGAT